jgi:hypothetical protein
MALPEIGHRTTIGGTLYELVSIYKLDDDDGHAVNTVTLTFSKLNEPPRRIEPELPTNLRSTKRAPKGTDS